MFSTSPSHLILLSMTSWSLASRPGLVFMVLFSTGSSRFVISLLSCQNVIIICLLCICLSHSAVFTKALFSVLYTLYVILRMQRRHLSPNPAFLLTLNSSKNEFLVGLKKQLAKIHNSSLNTNATHSARNLRFISDEHFTFSDQISSLSKSYYYHILVQLRVLIQIPKQPLPLTLPSFNPHEIIVILFTKS